MHDHKLCPRFNKDKKSDNQNKGFNKKVNSTELQENNKQSQLIGYVPAVPQPMNNEQGGMSAPVGMFPNLFVNPKK